MEERRFDVAVIGGGPGGYTAALYAARSGYKTAVIEKLSPGGQMATTEAVDNYPGFDEGIDGLELGERMKKGAERFGVTTLFEEVLSAELAGEQKRIRTAEGGVTARAVVLATGARPRKLGLAEEEALTGRGVAYCAACDGMRYRNKTVVVSGGGNSAVSDALTLAKLCKRVYLVHRRDSLRASRIYTEPLKKSGVEILWNSKIVRLLHDQKLTGVLLKDTVTGGERELGCEGLFVAVGREPETEMFRGQVELDEGGYVVADESTRTGLPGVFAVGDVRTKALRQIVTAAADGATASHFIEEYLK